MEDLYQLTHADLVAWMADQGHPRFRADQVFRWAHLRSATGFDEMTDLPGPLREELGGTFVIGPHQVVERQEAEDSTKLLVGLVDGQQVECVRMVTGPGTAGLCLSSQVGCAIRCVFCASGAEGFVRNLTAGEIIGQAITLRHLVGPARNVVFMGMGEPLLNLDAVVHAVRTFTDKHGWGLSAERITVATSGSGAGIRRYAEEGIATELAVSLNAPDDELRQRLMPGVRDSLAQVLEACEGFSARHNGRPVTYTYVVLRGVNDQPSHAEGLVRLLRGRRHHLNLIPYNAVPGVPYQRPPDREVAAFHRRLRAGGLNVSVRRSRGEEISAACGQLCARRATGPEVG